MSDHHAEENTLFKFPCKFPIKVICENDPEMVEILRTILCHHVKEVASIHLQTRESSEQKFLAISATFMATSKWQLDQIYQDISTHPKVKMVL